MRATRGYPLFGSGSPSCTRKGLRGDREAASTFGALATLRPCEPRVGYTRRMHGAEQRVLSEGLNLGGLGGGASSAVVVVERPVERLNRRVEQVAALCFACGPA